MKILLVNTVFEEGSTGRICKDLYDEYEKNGHQCCIAYGRGKVSPNYNSFKVGNIVSVFSHVFQTRFMDNHGFGSKIATKSLTDFIEEYNPDVIHLHNLHGYYLNIDILGNTLRNYHGYIIWTLHDQWPFSKGAAYIQEDKNSFYTKDYPTTFFSFRDNLSRKASAFKDLKHITLVTPSEWLKNSLKDSSINYPVEVINNGIDLNLFKSDKRNYLIEKYHLSEKKIILGCSSIWDRRKGLKYFEDLSDVISDEYQIVVIGRVKKKKKNNIIYIDKTESISELVSWYSISSVFLNTTLQDNFPTVNIEALACGTPVVTFDTGGSSEIIDNLSGISIKEKNVKNIYTAIIESQKLDRENCIERAKKFDKNKSYSEYIALINNYYGDKKRNNSEVNHN